MNMERIELDILMIRVNLYLANGRYVEARQVLDEVLVEEPGHGVAHGYMAWLCWALLDDADRAEAHYRAAIRFAPAHVAHYAAYARLLTETGRIDTLIELHRSAITVPGVVRSQLHELLAVALERADRFAEAGEAFRNAAAATSDPAEERRLMRQHVRVRERIPRRGWRALIAALV
jgi:tetratricopeptide (TPR) repeat protein